ncbi:MAG TPA: hypothetical protein PK096_00450 [Candidatus Saccharibacteria bacterium]|nr:hypothetical protein [Candidatus Saccharibacteria bacterium]HRK93826.1 hypothetical protein [Candidatus Saccharibacteria bacterium]
MADKQHIKRSIKQLQRVKTWQLVLLLILSLLISATFLRLNNIGMIERRTAVFHADEQGDEEVTRARLFDLQRYAAMHMNAGSGTIYLEDQYKRDTKEAIEKASVNDRANNINVKADATCKAQFGGYSQAYVQCFASELAKYPASTNTPDKVELPNANLYRHEFASPVWSPDFAGFSLLISLFITVLIVIRLLSLVLLRLLLRRHYQSI